MTTFTDYNAYELANLAGVAGPDSPDSPGAAFLLRVASDVQDGLDYNDGQLADEGDFAHEVADGAVPIYTQNRWQVFTDLCAWQEDLDELGGSQGDMTQDAGVALYMIAERLVYALLQERQEQDQEEADLEATIREEV